MNDRQPYRETAEPLLTTQQVQEFSEEKRRLEHMINAPAHISARIDRGLAQKQLRRLNEQLRDKSPHPYSIEQQDDAVAREHQLRDTWLEGMPTQAEMRRNPAGAVGKHRAWEARNKRKILEWKNIRRRLSASGMLGDPEYDTDIANIEMFRPHGGVGELNMHNEQIPGRTYNVPVMSAPMAIMNDTQAEVLKEHSPELFERMAMLPNDQRGLVLEYVDKLIDTVTAPPPKKSTPKLSEAERARRSEHMKKVNEERRLKKRALEQRESEDDLALQAEEREVGDALDADLRETDTSD